MKLLFATNNRGKLSELRQMLEGAANLQLLSLDELGLCLDVEETGSTFAANAVLKATAAMQASGLAALADDSGLEVDALGGAPGIHSARYAGADATDAQRVTKLLAELDSVPSHQRTARFRCAVVFIDPRRPEQIEIREGTCEGVVTRQPRGNHGFGYDPVFYVEELGCTFAEGSPDDKHRLSHRGRAMRQMAEHLRSRVTPNAAG